MTGAPGTESDRRADSTAPPANGFGQESAQSDVDGLPRRAIVSEHDGSVTIDSFTVMHERDGSPVLAIAACLTPDGGRTWATSNESDVMKRLMADDLIGTDATVKAGTLFL